MAFDFAQPRRLKLVVVGNGMAGMRAVEELLKIAPDLYEITVFGAEPQPNYNRILLSPVLAGEQTFDGIVLNGYDWYRENGIRLHTGVRVERIDRKRRIVFGSDGTEEPYDRVLLATGSNPALPPLPGIKLPGVLAYRDIADTHAMIEAAGREKKAVVIGGGLLGLEAAYGLARRGMLVTVVHLMDVLMERQLDEAAGWLLKHALEARGQTILTGADTEAVLGDDRVEGIRLKDGREIPADLVVMAVGIKPNVALARICQCVWHLQNFHRHIGPPEGLGQRAGLP